MVTIRRTTNLTWIKEEIKVWIQLISPLDVSGSHSGSQRWGRGVAFCGRCADSLCGTRRRTRRTGSTAPCPAGAADTAGRRTAPRRRPSLPLHPRHHHRRLRRKMKRSQRKRRLRRWMRKMRRMERATRGGEGGGVFWADPVVYCQRKKKEELLIIIIIKTCTSVQCISCVYKQHFSRH